MSGKLYLTPTPIGNLEDITLRALRILKEADLILAEDTRTSKVLLQHYSISTPLISHHAFNEHHTVPAIIEKLHNGQTLALITDAGTPGISDPGYLLARACIKEGIPVECLPGATAFVPALVQSGLPCNDFVFVGFLPPKKGRQTKLSKLKEETRTMIFYESPHKIQKTIQEFKQLFGAERQASVSRELTKKFEETVRGSLEEIEEKLKSMVIKGEFVIIVEGEKT